MDERTLSLTSEDIFNSFFKVGSLPHIGSEAEIQDFIKNNLSNNEPASPDNPRGIPRVASLELIKAYINSRQQQGNTPEMKKLVPVNDDETATNIPSDQQPTLATQLLPYQPQVAMDPVLGMQLAAAAAASGNPVPFKPQDYLAAAFIHSQLAQQQAAGQLFPIVNADAAKVMLVPTSAGNPTSEEPKSGQSSGGHAPFPIATESGARNITHHHQRRGTAKGAGGTTTTGGDNDDDKAMERKRKRMLSNRESARRSRKRKQDHVAELEVTMNRLGEDHAQQAAKIKIMTENMQAQEERIAALQAENERLKLLLQNQNATVAPVATAPKGGRASRRTKATTDQMDDE